MGAQTELFSKIFEILKKIAKMGRRRAPSGVIRFLIRNWGRARRGDPFEKKDGVKILIFTDFRILRQNGPRSAPDRPQMTPETPER